MASLPRDSACVTVRLPVVTDTETSSTPFIRLTAVSILDAQEAQSIPLTR